MTTPIRATGIVSNANRPFSFRERIALFIFVNLIVDFLLDFILDFRDFVKIYSRHMLFSGLL